MPNNLHQTSPAARRRGGFSFIEVLFAVILLGIGFIMIAGIFPVALSQTQATANDTSGTLIGRDAVRMIQPIATDSLFPATGGIVVPFSPNNSNVAGVNTIMRTLGGNAFFTSDHRFAWLGFYRRFTGDSFAQVFIIVLQNPNFLTYTSAPPVPPQTAGLDPLIPSSITAKFTYTTTTGNSTVDISDVTTGVAPQNAVTGAFVLVSNDSGGGNIPAGSLNGRLLRLGTQTASTSSTKTFQLQPGFDLKDANDATSAAVRCYIIGAAPIAPDGTGSNFTGPNQDIAALSTFIRINN